MMSVHAMQNHQLLVLFIAVLTILPPATHSQSYFLTLGDIPLTPPNGPPPYRHQLLLIPTTPPPPVPRPTQFNYTGLVYPFEELPPQLDDNSSTLFLAKNSTRDKSKDLSQTTMDVITIVWYVATFLALAAFFVLMACSDRRCSNELRSGGAPNSNEHPIPPPTPSPSYSQFAPPSYDTVVRMQHSDKPSIFVIPLGPEDQTKESVDTTDGGNITSATDAPPIASFYTIDEVLKHSS